MKAGAPVLCAPGSCLLRQPDAARTSAAARMSKSAAKAGSQLRRRKQNRRILRIVWWLFTGAGPFAADMDTTDRFRPLQRPGASHRARPVRSGSGPPGRMSPRRPCSGTYFSHEDCVLLQTTGVRPQSSGGEVRSGRETQSSVQPTAPRPATPHPTGRAAQGLSARATAPRLGAPRPHRPAPVHRAVGHDDGALKGPRGATPPGEAPQASSASSPRETRNPSSSTATPETAVTRTVARSSTRSRAV